MSNKYRYKIDELIVRWSKKYKKLVKIPLPVKEDRIKKYKVNGELVIKDPYLDITDCTKHFMSTMKGAKKRDGRVTLHQAYGRKKPKAEEDTAERFAEEFGWDVFVDKENTRDVSGKSKYYVDLFTGYKWWEEKSPSSLNAIETRLKVGLRQLTGMQKNTRGGVVLNIRDNNSDKLNMISNEKISNRVLNTINEESRIDCYVMVTRKNKVIKVYKTKHK